jgi:hypothetical protein
MRGLNYFSFREACRLTPQGIRRKTERILCSNTFGCPVLCSVDSHVALVFGKEVGGWSQIVEGVLPRFCCSCRPHTQEVATRPPTRVLSLTSREALCSLLGRLKRPGSLDGRLFLLFFSAGSCYSDLFHDVSLLITIVPFPGC